MNGDYKVLRMAVTVFKAVAWIAAGLGVISALIIFSGIAQPDTSPWMGIVTLVVGAFYFFIFMVASGMIKLLLDMNERIK